MRNVGRKMMKPFLKWLITWAGIALVACALLGVNRFGSQPRIRFTNKSGHTLRDVTISGNGFNKTYRQIEDRESKRFTATVNGESGISVRFSADGQKIDKDAPAYIEAHGGYYADLTVSENLDVSCHSGTMFYWF